MLGQVPTGLPHIAEIVQTSRSGTWVAADEWLRIQSTCLAERTSLTLLA